MELNNMMTPTERIDYLEKELNELKERILASEQYSQPVSPQQLAKEWLLDYLSKGFEVKLTKGYITYYRDEQWIFQQDLKNEYLWCYYYKVWQVFETDFGMNYEQIQALHKEVVVEALNCEGLTPGLTFLNHCPRW